MTGLPGSESREREGGGGVGGSGRGDDGGKRSVKCVCRRGIGCVSFVAKTVCLVLNPYRWQYQ